VRGPARFAEDTAVERLDAGRYGATVSDRWNVLGGAAPNGGYLMAMAARAMRDASGRPDPVTLTAHFLRPTPIGAVEVHTDIVKEGRRHATVQASLVADGSERLRLLGAFGDLTTADGPTQVDRTPPELPPRERCVDANAAADTDPQGFAPPILRRFDHLMAPGTMDWARGEPLGRGVMEGHARWAGGEERMDPLGLLVLADAYPPAVFNAGSIIGWVPTVELTVQVRKRPAPGWLRTRFTTEHVTRGYLEEDGEIWDADGDLVALSRQLALVAQPG
jgi:acyl-CoA thioesterase